MFGDIMHGTMLICLSTYLCFMGIPIPGTLTGELFKVRYFLLLMGIFSAFCGLMYNDMTSLPLMIFGESCYEITAHAGAHVE